jgi:hypothetical protein
MRHGRHYVEQLMGDAPLRTVREIAVADFHAIPDSDVDLSTLQQSIGSVGVLQPLLVTLDGGRYHVIAGRNRLRAAAALGLQTVPCLVHDVARDGLDGLRQAAGRRALPPRTPDIRTKEAVDTAAAAVAGRAAAPNSAVAVAADDSLRLAVLADLMHVELQRGETLHAAVDALDSQSPIAREPLAAGSLVEPLLARIKPEARLRNARVEVTVSDADYRVEADKRLLSVALQCMAHGMLMLCSGGTSKLQVSFEGTRVRPALIVEVSLDAATIDLHAARTFFDGDGGDHPTGHVGALMAACVARVAREHGGRAGLRPIPPHGCALTLVVPQPVQA